MNKIHLKEIRKNAKYSVRNAEISPKGVTLAFCGILYLLYLLPDIGNYFISQMESSGISGTMRIQGISSILEGLNPIIRVFSIIWTGCYAGYCVELICGRKADFRSLGSHLNRGWAFLGVEILRIIYLTGFGILFMIPAYLLCGQTVKYMEITEDLLQDYDSLYTAVESAIRSSNLLPGIICLIVLALIGVFVISYRYRISVYYALSPQHRAQSAIQASKMTMKGRVFELFRLDLSLVWYPILNLAVSYGLLILDDYLSFTAGQYLAFEVLAYLILILFDVLFMPYVQCCYALYAGKVMNPEAAFEVNRIEDNSAE